MPIKGYISRLQLVLLLLSLLYNQGFAQEIAFDLKSVDSLTINYENVPVTDINGEICSVVNLTTDIDSIKFYSNLGVEKVVKTEFGYRIWIPCQSNNLKLIMPGFPLSEYTFPASPFRYSVFSIVLKVNEYQRITYSDTLRKSLSLTSSPSRSRVFVNDRCIGRSPVYVNAPDYNVFDYSFKKKAYETFHSTDSFNIKSKNISVTLSSLFKSKRYFLLFNIKADQSYKGGLPIITDLYDIAYFSINFGTIGMTGWYGSIGYNYLRKNLETYQGDYEEAQKISVVLGITQQLGKSIFFYGGPGYTNRYYKARNTTFSYLDHQTLENDDNLGSINLNMGFIFRIGWYSLFQIDSSIGIDQPFWSVGFGVGVNIAGKKNTIKNN
jgi:hypothetical protein